MLADDIVPNDPPVKLLAEQVCTVYRLLAYVVGLELARPSAFRLFVVVWRILLAPFLRFVACVIFRQVRVADVGAVHHARRPERVRKRLRADDRFDDLMRVG